ncbi:endolytic transglycosylase MltG [Rubrobacter calidifluminis]|uniref:endolytic transglycosylase MltG n=1 Tax=Rubrobacter calidifluminis TaxID=1392640 RepID=UPI00235E343D|nr:endolytic transglycosylase MltG [Rubrobacter calidifluminis]
MSRSKRPEGWPEDDLEQRLEALRSERREQGRRRGRTLAAIVGLASVVVLLALVYLIYATAMGDGSRGTGKAVTVEVRKGDTLSSVAGKLDRAGVIKNSFIFELQARMEGDSADIKPGRYRFHRGQSTGSILRTLTANRPAPTFKITVPEGLTLGQTAREVASQSHISRAAFERAAHSTDYPYAFLHEPGVKSTEGFLFPKTYDFREGTGARQVVNRMLEQYAIETQGLDLRGAERRLGLSEYQLVIVASLIEKESANRKERPLIASVIYNRLHRGMPLQIDATVQYALGRPHADLSLQDLKVRSPYNTYLHKGLPPGPIDNPSLSSIKAAAHPAETDYLYYVLEKGGRHHYFTSSYQKFLRAKAAAGR